MKACRIRCAEGWSD